ncbi:MAG: aminotransferase class I/II-fold pyridoxal phosphate-dependent enzyme [Rhodobacteraceae bacterium]|nr:aminotransferase class I/II-fold pyridoxal phosphate-dependent enzyme [Paracoccaceae bacterium]
MIDLRSDTATRPSQGMRQAIARAEVGDEQRGEDPTTLALEARVAKLLGHEKALFLPSGTMCNQISFLVHCRPGDEVICAANAHVFGSEAAGAAALAGAQFRPVHAPTGIFSAADVEPLLRAPRHRSPRSRVVTIEQTTNRGGGRVWPVAAIAELAGLTRQTGLALHMDGARLLNASVATGIAPADFGALCDSVWIDLSKGLGCPFGGVLAGPAEFIDEALIWKHRLGGAMRQSGIMAAAGLYALDHNVDRLAEDHENAARFAQRLKAIPGLGVDPADSFTNIVFLRLENTGIRANDLAKRLSAHGVAVNVEGPVTIRIVTHHDVSRADIDRAADLIADLIAGAAPGKGLAT